MTKDNPEYEVGYKKPPKNSQFKAGQSGNHKGRPKGSLNFIAEIDRELSTRVTVKENGRNKQVTKKRIIAKRLVNKAIEGDLKAAGMLLNQAYLSDHQRQAKGISPSETFTAADQMGIASIAKRIRESLALENLVSSDPAEPEVTQEPTLSIDLTTNTDEGVLS